MLAVTALILHLSFKTISRRVTGNYGYVEMIQISLIVIRNKVCCSFGFFYEVQITLLFKNVPVLTFQAI